MPNSTRNTQKLCLDLPIVGSRGAPDGLAVAQNMELAKAALEHLLLPKELEHIGEQITLIKSHAKPLLSARKNLHPLSELRERAPLYCAFSDGGKVLSGASAQPILVARWLALFAAVDNFGANKYAKRLANFVHQALFSQSRHITLIRDCCPDLPTAEQTSSSVQKIESFFASSEANDPRLREFRQILENLHRRIETLERSRQRAINTPAVHSPTSNDKGIRPETPTPKETLLGLKSSRVTTKPFTPKPLSISLADSLSLSRDSPDTLPENQQPVLTEPALFAQRETVSATQMLSQHVQTMALQRGFAGRTTLGFSHNEAKASYEALISFHPANLEEQAAQLIWTVVASSARAFIDIQSAMANPKLAAEAEDGELFAIEYENNSLILYIKHLIASNLPQTEGIDKNTELQDYFTLSISIPAQIDAVQALTFFKVYASTDEQQTRLAHAYRSIRKFIRLSVPRFIEQRLREVLATARFYCDYDLASTQLIFSDTFQYSDADLHYIAVPESQLQANLVNAQQKVYGNLIPEVKSYSTALVGAPRAALPNSVFAKATKWLNTSLRRLRKLDPGKWGERQSILVDTTLHLIGVGSAHRFHDDLAKLTRWDFCLSQGLVFFNDKPTNRAMYRRIAVLASGAIRVLKIYLQHLKILSKNQTVPQEVKERAKASLEGSAPLFWLWNGDFIEPTPRQTIRGLLPNSVPTYAARHIQSTQLRKAGAAPLLIETHLGHHLEGPVLNNTGLISPKELSTEIRPYLDTLVQDLGYKIEVSSTDNPPPTILSRTELIAMHRAHQQQDAQRWQRQLRKWCKDLRMHKLRSAVMQAVQHVVPEFGRTKMSPAIRVSKTMACQIQKLLVAQFNRNSLSAYRASRQLRRTLTGLKNIPGAHIQLPPLLEWNPGTPIKISRAHFAAADMRASLEAALMQQIESAPTHIGWLTQHALTVWGEAENLATASLWMSSYRKTSLIANTGYQIIDTLDKQSRTIAGLPFLLCSAWHVAGFPKIAPIQNGPPEMMVSDEDWDACISYARRIQYSPFIANILTGETPVHELGRERLIDLLHGRKTNRKHLRNRRKNNQQVLPANASSTRLQNNIGFRELKSCINDRDSHEFNKQRVQRWVDQKHRPQVLTLLGEWAVMLLERHANLKTTGRLKKETVKDYLLETWDVLSVLFPDGTISDLDPDEIVDLLGTEGLLQNEVDSPANRIRGTLQSRKSIKRFFRDMSEIYALPPLPITANLFKKEEVDADIISSAELQEILQSLNHWHKDPTTESLLIPGISQILEVLPVYAAHGVRRRELSHVKNKDIFSHNDQHELILRPHRERPIKTRAGRRHFTIKAKVTPSLSSQKSNYRYDHIQRVKSSHRLWKETDKILKAHTAGARLHHFRHTIGTQFLLNGILEADPVDRIRKIHRCSTDIGHAHYSTTACYYGHALFHGIAISSASDHPRLSNATFSKLFNVPGPTVRKRRARAATEAEFLQTFYSSDPKPLKIQKNQENISSTQKLQKETQQQACTEPSNKTISLKQVTSWILLTARGNDPFVAAGDVNFSRMQLEKVATACADSQREFNWACISDERLREFLECLHINGTSFNSEVKKHGRFTGPEIDQLVNDLGYYDGGQLMSMYSLLQGQNLVGAKDLVIPLDTVTQNSVEAEFRKIGLPVKLEKNPRNKRQLRIYLEAVLHKERTRRNLTKLIIIAISTTIKSRNFT